MGWMSEPHAGFLGGVLDRVCVSHTSCCTFAGIDPGMASGFRAAA